MMDTCIYPILNQYWFLIIVQSLDKIRIEVAEPQHCIASNTPRNSDTSYGLWFI